MGAIDSYVLKGNALTEYMYVPMKYMNYDLYLEWSLSCLRRKVFNMRAGQS